MGVDQVPVVEAVQDGRDGDPDEADRLLPVAPVMARPMKYPVMPAHMAWLIGSVRNRQMYWIVMSCRSMPLTLPVQRAEVVGEVVLGLGRAEDQPAHRAEEQVVPWRLAPASSAARSRPRR